MTDLQVANVQVAGRSRELLFRPGTTDLAVIQQVFGQASYGYSHLKRAAEIDAFAQNAHLFVIDAGANIGASAVYFHLCFPEALVFAIEPEADNFELLCQNTQGLPVVRVHGALASESADLSISDPGEGAWGYRTRAPNGGPIVRGLTINEIYASTERTPLIVKIDVEGAEKEIFSQNTEWIAKTPIIMIEPHDWLLPKELSLGSFLQAIAGEARDFIISGENIFSIRHEL